MKRLFLALLLLLAPLTLAAQCTQAKVDPTPAPIPRDADGGVLPTPAPDAGLDRCLDVLDLVRMSGCTLPNDWLDACRTARAHGATFNLGCFVKAVTCEAVDACMGGS